MEEATEKQGFHQRLRELAQLIDPPLLPSRARAPECGPSNPKGPTDAPETKPGLWSAQPGLSQEGPVGEISPGPASSLLRTDRGVVANSGVSQTPTPPAP